MIVRKTHLQKLIFSYFKVILVFFRPKEELHAVVVSLAPPRFFRPEDKLHSVVKSVSVAPPALLAKGETARCCNSVSLAPPLPQA